jgi:sulfite reductase alpha subunit-like flavoprotein
LNFDLSLVKVFGLGNSSYEFFNEMSKKMDTRMEQLGAKRVFDRGEADAIGKYGFLGFWEVLSCVS